MSKEVKLSVNNLKVSFRTDAGKVQAVRDLTFDLYKGETLEIVGRVPAGTKEVAFSLKGLNGAKAYEGFFRMPQGT